MPRPLLLALPLLLASPLTMAHPADAMGVTAGLVHAFSGFDHLLAMLALGIWSAALPPRQQTLLRTGMPVVLVAALLAGVMVAPASVALADMGIALSLMLSGVLIANRQRQIPAPVALLTATAFVSLHGFAHSEALQGDVSGFALGLVLTSSLLLQAGRWMGMQLQQHRPALLFLTGTLVSGAGLGLALV